MTKRSLARVALGFVSLFGLFLANGSAASIFSFSDSGPTTGTFSGNTVSGVDFNSITYNSQTYTVNQFVESYSNGVLTFAVSGGGSLASTGLFDNVTGTFFTINESAPVFSNNPIVLFTAVTNLSISSAFLTDIGLGGASDLALDPSTNISVTSLNGSVISTEASLSLSEVPDPSTFSTLGIGLLFLSAPCFAGRRRKLLVRGKESDSGCSYGRFRDTCSLRGRQ